MTVRNKVFFNLAPEWGGVCKRAGVRTVHAYSDNSA